MKYPNALLFSLVLVMTGLIGQAGAVSIDPSSMESTMKRDPAAMYSMIMQKIMSDPAIHRRMNEYMTNDMKSMQMNTSSISREMP